MSSFPEILVVTPTLGLSPFLDRTVASLFAQTVPVRHVLVAPAPRVSALAARYRHAVVVPDAGPAGGLYGALNAALAGAPDSWAWFTYINDDDALLPGFSQVARRHLARTWPEAVAYGDVELIDSRERRTGLITVERNPAWIAALLQRGISPLMQQGMLFRRDCVARLGGFDGRYRLCADLDFWLRAYAAGERFRHYAAVVAQFRLRPGQLSGNTALTVREQSEIVARHLPRRVPWWQWHSAVWRYRLCNLPRYVGRMRRRGLRTSYQILERAS